MPSSSAKGAVAAKPRREAQNPAPTPSMPGLGAVAACFFVSGAASLVLEVVWTRQVRLVFGSTTLAISTVLAAYMLGLGIGGLVGASAAKRLRNGVKAYGWIEIGIAAYAAVVPILIGWLPAVNYALTGALSFWPAALCRFLLALVVLLVPTILMGATLPLLVEALVRRDAEVARRVGFLYGLNTLGAVAGVFLATFFLLPRIGLFRSNLTAAIADVLVGVVALAVLAPRFARTAATADERPKAANASGVGFHPALIAYGLVGFTSLTYEVSWSRALAMVLGGSIYSFASMLAAFLTGIALGSLIARRWFDRLARPLLAYAIGVGLLGLLSLATLMAFRELPTLFLEIVLRVGTAPLAISATQVGVSMAAMLGPTLVLGALFPLLIRAVAQRAEDASAAVGRAYFANTLGSGTGAFAAGFVLIPLLGLQHTLALAVALNLATAAALVVWQKEWLGVGRIATAIVALAAAALVIAVPPGWSPAELSRGVYRDLDYDPNFGLEPKPLIGVPPDGILLYREGINTTVSVHRQRSNTLLKVNGKTDASTNVDMQTQIMVGQLGMLFNPKPERVLIIGLASGVSVGSAALHEPKALDVVELEPAMIEASHLYDDFNNRPLERPFVRVIADDGRNVLANARASYDLIASEPSNPWITGAASLFTEEFFSAAHAALTPDGSLVQWMHLYGMPTEAFRSVLAALQSVFPYVYVFEPWSFPGDLLLLARKQPLTIADLPRWENLSPAVRADLLRSGQFSTADLWSGMLVSADGVRKVAAAATARNTDDSLYVETAAPWAFYQSTANEARGILVGLDPGVEEFFTKATPPLDPEMINALALSYALQFGTTRIDTLERLLDAARAVGLNGDGALASLLRAPDDGTKRQRLDLLVETFPSNFALRLKRAEILHGERRFADAAADAEIAISLQPDDERARFLRVKALNQLGRGAEALADARVLASSTFTFRDGRAWLEAALAAAQAGDLADAIAQVRSYVTRWPDDKTGWATLAKYYRLAGDAQNAADAEENERRVVYNQAIDGHLNALRFEREGKLEDARVLLEAVIENDPTYSPAAAELKRLTRK